MIYIDKDIEIPAYFKKNSVYIKNIKNYSPLVVTKVVNALDETDKFWKVALKDNRILGMSFIKKETNVKNPNSLKDAIERYKQQNLECIKIVKKNLGTKIYNEYLDKDSKLNKSAIKIKQQHLNSSNKLNFQIKFEQKVDEFIEILNQTPNYLIFHKKKFLAALAFVATIFWLNFDISPEKKIIKMESFKSEIIDTENFSLNPIYSEENQINIQKLIKKNKSLLSLDDKNELSVIEARNNMLTELMLSFIDPSEDKLIKERILIFFRNARDDNKRFIGVPPIPEEGENMYVTDVVQWSSIFDVETRLRFYEALANYKNINYNLSSPETIEQELCHAVRKEALSYASALIDIGKDIVNIGKIRCTPGPYPKVFRGSTVGIKDDYEAKQVLGHFDNHEY
jgi:hypothetical protein